ncbi:MAG: hypothetical protein IKS52_03720 [Clostridia bacterium]|nr:hypothetical protein [Clostridia bacterium]MBR4442360.1 hypothetical protein [Clostridia bacterium]
MDYAFAVFMFCFSGAILLYAGLLAVTRDYNLLPLRARVATKPRDRKAYTFQISKAVALTAAAPALGGLVGLWNPLAALVAMIAAFIVCLWLGTKITRAVQ